MNHLLRLAFCASLLGLFFVGGYTLRPPVMEELGLDFWEWPRWQLVFRNETARAKALGEARKHCVGRVEAKNQISFDLIAGRFTLTEAAARFGELPHPPANLWDRLQDEFKGGKEESMCRHVIRWACQLVERQPAHAEALRLRLEGQLQVHLRKSQNPQ